MKKEHQRKLVDLKHKLEVSYVDQEERKIRVETSRLVKIKRAEQESIIEEIKAEADKVETENKAKTERSQILSKA